MFDDQDKEALKASIECAATEIASSYNHISACVLKRIMAAHHKSLRTWDHEVLANDDKTHCAQALYSVLNKTARELLHLDDHLHLTMRVVDSDDRERLGAVLAGIWHLASAPVRTYALSTDKLIVAELIERLCKYWTCVVDDFPDMQGMTEEDVTQDRAYGSNYQMFAFIRQVIASCGWFVERDWLWRQLIIVQGRLREQLEVA